MSEARISEELRPSIEHLCLIKRGLQYWNSSMETDDAFERFLTYLEPALKAANTRGVMEACRLAKDGLDEDTKADIAKLRQIEEILWATQPD